MATEEPKPNAAQRLLLVMRDVGGIEKQKAEGVTYAFRSIEQITVRAQEALIEHGLLLVPIRAHQIAASDRNIGTSEKPRFQRVASVAMRYAFVNVDQPADRIEIEMVGESSDMSAKATQQAITFALKYALIQSLCIGDPSDDADRQPSSEGSEPIVVHDWQATDEEIESLRVAMSFVPESQRPRFNDWWKRLEVGSISNRKINARHLPAALRVAEMLASLEEEAAAV